MAARAGSGLGSGLRAHLDGLDLAHDGEDERLVDLARVAVQLSATAFEIAFLEAATRALSPDVAGEVG